MANKRLALLNGSTIANVAVWDGVKTYSPGFSTADITTRIYLGRGHTYVSLPENRTHNIVIDGNSIADAELLTTRAIEASIIEAGLTVNDFVNVAASAKTSTGAIANAPVSVDRLYDSAFEGKNICFYWEISNDLALNGYTAAQAHSAVITYVRGRKKAGFGVIVGTCLPRTGEGADIETKRLSVNQLIKDSAGTEGFTVADVASDAVMGNISTCANTTYYSDGTHPTNAGQELLIDYFRDALLEVL
jgi:hypothetical protein